MKCANLGILKFTKVINLNTHLNKIPGSDLSITNSGRIIFYDHSEHFNGKVKIHSYSKEGKLLFTKMFEGATLFEFSPSGRTMGLRNSDGIEVVSLNDGISYSIEKGLQFSFGDDDEFVAVAQSNKILIYQNSSLLKTIQTGIELPRKVIISLENNLVGVIDKFQIKIYSLGNGNLIFEDNGLAGDLSFRDLKIVDNKIIAGIHKRNNQESTGLLRVYELDGDKLIEKSGDSRQLQQSEKMNLEKESEINYDPIPWPFFPFDSMRTVWNHYEQHMGLGGTDSYLHQGLRFNYSNR